LKRRRYISIEIQLVAVGCRHLEAKLGKHIKVPPVKRVFPLFLQKN
jgi:hypothetical protein